MTGSAQTPATWDEPNDLMGRALAVLSMGVTVESLDRSVAFFQNVLDFELVSRFDRSGPEFERHLGVPGAIARVARIRLDDEILELSEYLAPRGRPFPQDSRGNDLWFQHLAIVTCNMDAAYSRLCDFGVEHASPAPQRLPDWNPAAGGIRAFYFKDPDGHFLELLQFPPDKGDPKWRRPCEALFGGIDHTAIVVSSTQASLTFYRELLGMEVAGESRNHGLEQERLNNVPGARLHITTLRAVSGPGVELLEYLHPRDGRARPADSRPLDLLHWHTTITVGDLNQTLEALQTAGARILSEVVASHASGGRCPAVLVSDPDGHVIELAQLPWREPSWIP